MQADATCSFCGQAATMEPAPAIRVCCSCAKRIAILATESDSGALDIWSSVAPVHDRVQRQPMARGEIDLDRAFEAFKEGVAKQISAGDAASHGRLAEAYREMGLHADAIREAAIAVAAATVPATAKAPLAFLLTPPLLTPDGLGRLRERLNRRAGGK